MHGYVHLVGIPYCICRGRNHAFGAFRQHNDLYLQNHRQYYINKVNFITDLQCVGIICFEQVVEINDSIHYKGFPIYYGDNLSAPEGTTNNLRIVPGSLYNEPDVQRTYSNFGRLQALKYTNIRSLNGSDTAKLNAYVMLMKGNTKLHRLSWKEPILRRLGAAASVLSQNRNGVQGLRTFGDKAAWRIRSGICLQGYNHEDYTELEPKQL